VSIGRRLNPIGDAARQVVHGDLGRRSAARADLQLQISLVSRPSPNVATAELHLLVGWQVLSLRFEKPRNSDKMVCLPHQ
jgi:hypothetical protein